MVRPSGRAGEVVAFDHPDALATVGEFAETATERLTSPDDTMRVGNMTLNSKGVA